MLYILKFENMEDGETYTSIWDNPDAAHQQAVSEILDDIREGWDLDDPDVRAEAKEMSDYAMNGDFPRVLDLWNDHQHNRCGPGRFWSVEERDICTLAEAAPINGILFADENEEDEEVEEEEDDNTPYLATTQGATCRGPCNNYSPDAYATKRDGTYCCWQCKLMGGYT
jgi:hypothetical protein